VVPVQKEVSIMTLKKFKEDVESIVDHIKEDSFKLSKLIDEFDASTPVPNEEKQPLEK
jgi:hypothetical protein